jgi:hypothetical protein
MIAMKRLNEPASLDECGGVRETGTLATLSTRNSLGSETWSPSRARRCGQHCSCCRQSSLREPSCLPVRLDELPEIERRDTLDPVERVLDDACYVGEADTTVEKG